MPDLDLWNDGATRAVITGFVDRISAEGSADYVEPAARVAVFDNDGTLWCEKPLIIQVDFTVRRLAELAGQDPELRGRQPYRAAYEGDLHWLEGAAVKHYRGDDGDLELLAAAITSAFDQVAVEDYERQVTGFFDEAEHPTLERLYRLCGYAPMVQLLRYLEGHGFATYIASGGDRDFVRPVAQEMYGIPRERVIGSALGLAFDASDGRGRLLYTSTMDFLDDGPEKPVRIWSRVGRRPVLAVGNSNGDLPMLAYTAGHAGPSLPLLLHDDADREFDYTAGAEDALTVAADQDWTVVSIKDDWRQVFAGPGS